MSLSCHRRDWIRNSSSPLACAPLPASPGVGQDEAHHREAVLLEVHLLVEGQCAEVALHIHPMIGTARGDVARDVRPMRTAVIARACRDRAANRADDGRKGEAAVVPLHSDVARYDDGDPLGVVLYVGPSRRLLTHRKVARERKYMLQVGLAKGSHGLPQQVRGHQHGCGEAVGLDFPRAASDQFGSKVS